MIRDDHAPLLLLYVYAPYYTLCHVSHNTTNLVHANSINNHLVNDSRSCEFFLSLNPTEAETPSFSVDMMSNLHEGTFNAVGSARSMNTGQMSGTYLSRSVCAMIVPERSLRD